MYNSWLKEDFLAGYKKESTRSTNRKYLDAFSRIEAIRGKDICQFSSDQLGDALVKYIISPSTLNTVASVVNNYLRHCRILKYCDNNIDVNRLVAEKEIKAKLSDRIFDNGFIVNEAEMYSIADYFHNKRDAVYHLLFYEGFTEKGIMDLKETDFNPKTSYLKDRVISSKTSEYIIKSLQETKYIGNNGKGKRYNFDDSSGRLVKKSASESTIDGKASNSNFGPMTRLMKIDMGKPQLTLTRIRESGLIHYLVKQKKCHPDLDDNIILEAIRRYGFLLNTDNPYSIKHEINQRKIQVDKFIKYYSAELKVDEKSIPSSEENNFGDRDYSWVQELINKGKKGEQKLIHELKNAFPTAVIKQVGDDAGFDILFNNKGTVYYFEVKATHSLRSNLYITEHELRVADNPNLPYVLAIVVLSNKYEDVNDSADIYFVRNPVDKLNISVNELVHSTDTGVCDILDHNFAVKLKDNFASLEQFTDFKF